MDNAVLLLVFLLVYLGMVFGRYPGLALDRTGIALLGAIGPVAAASPGGIAIAQEKRRGRPLLRTAYVVRFYVPDYQAPPGVLEVASELPLGWDRHIDGRVHVFALRDVQDKATLQDRGPAPAS